MFHTWASQKGTGERFCCHHSNYWELHTLPPSFLMYSCCKLKPIHVNSYLRLWCQFQSCWVLYHMMRCSSSGSGLKRRRSGPNFATCHSDGAHAIVLEWGLLSWKPRWHSSTSSGSTPLCRLQTLRLEWQCTLWNSLITWLCTFNFTVNFPVPNDRWPQQIL